MGVRESVQQTFERWDGKGVPGAKGEQIHIAARLVNIADVLVVFHRSDGVEGAVDVARKRRGTQFDPALVDLVEVHAEEIFDGLDDAATWEAVIGSEPAGDEVLTD